MINKVILMGRLTADPKFSQTPSGTALCRFSVAVDRKFADKSTGERQADFISVVAWNKTAEFVSKYFAKGSMIIVEGSIRNNNYESNGVKHYSYEVHADDVSFGETKAAAGANRTSSNNGYSNNYQVPQQNTAVQNPVNAPNNDISVGDVSAFEEILGDGDVPF
jgi:single-strand DNA-binding protein